MSDHTKLTREEFVQLIAPFKHDSRELIRDDITHLLAELHRICKQHNIPYVAALEESYSENGSFVSSWGYFPEHRAKAIGLPGRSALLQFAAQQSASTVALACACLIKNNILDMTPR